jgi:hypothetical protein
MTVEMNFMRLLQVSLFQSWLLRRFVVGLLLVVPHQIVILFIFEALSDEKIVCLKIVVHKRHMIEQPDLAS